MSSKRVQRTYTVEYKVQAIQLAKSIILDKIKIDLDDYRKRNEIEGVNGTLKRKHGFNLILDTT